MWPFSNKKSILSSGLFEGMTDCHCHLLPGVDDGFGSMDETLAALAAYAKMGIREVWLTPHIMEDMPNTTDKLRRRFDELMERVGASGEEMPQLRLSAENMLDSLFAERLAKGDLIKYGRNDNELLVETSYMMPPLGMDDMIKGIMDAGLTPVLAHPERYNYMTEQDYLRYKGMGVKFQLNVTSMAGAYGHSAQHKAEWLMNSNFYSYKGTDCHNLRSLMHEAKRKTLGKDTIERLRML